MYFAHICTIYMGLAQARPNYVFLMQQILKSRNSTGYVVVCLCEKQINRCAYILRSMCSG